MELIHFCVPFYDMTWWALSCGLNLQPPPSRWKLCSVYLPGTMVLLIFKQDSFLLVAGI